MCCTSSFPVLQDRSGCALTSIFHENRWKITYNKHFLALLVIGSTDILFAVDSIPAILFRYLKTGVSAILLFIGAKMLATAIPEVGHFFASHSWVPLAVIVAILIISILMSVLANEREAALERQQVNQKKQ